MCVYVLCNNNGGVCNDMAMQEECDQVKCFLVLKKGLNNNGRIGFK